MAVYDINGNVISSGGSSVTTVISNENVSPNEYDVIVKNINHRGYTGDGATENTLDAYRASKNHGFYYVETDVRYTSDGVAILMHNDYISYNGVSTAVASLTYAQWKEEYPNLTTFEEIVALSKNIGLHPYFDIKAGTQAQMQALVDIVHAYEMGGKVTWIDGNATRTQYIHAYDPYARIGVMPVGTTTFEYTLQRANAVKGDYNDVFIDVHINGADSTVISACKTAGFPLEVWTFVSNTSEIINADPYISGWTANVLMAGKVLHDDAMGNEV